MWLPEVGWGQCGDLSFLTCDQTRKASKLKYIYTHTHTHIYVYIYFNFHVSKDTIKKVKKQSIEWERRFRIEYPEYIKNSKNSKLVI